MKSESDLTDILNPQSTEISSRSISSGASLQRKQPSQPYPNYLDAEGDDALFAKAQTLMINQSPDAVIDSAFEAPSETIKYIQGVVQGQRVYIITNLLGESESLVQPQMVWTIGRNREAALPLKDRAMSRRHAVLMFVREVGFQLIDLNSMNGSFVNGVRIQQRHILKDGDRVRVGSINFTFLISRSHRSLDAIHPEVLARFNACETISADFMDYEALEDPEVLFKKRQ
ncbi:FHA domain-containing protein [Kovacikia minuta CCNUW1]|uniref:FHA domain-containing protein n=1 Tax=Kovacikia minuta TaxID=2931930 RepID=UPI001CCF1E25|nr:FHA domain-containing protein [Kovacikia minuta]UBF25205.1 FHA domain-containing protein [Kovacikia minuta CCNUW1]